MLSIMTAGLVESVAFVGGDWAEYPDAYVEMASFVKQMGIGTVLYTGVLFEELPDDVCAVTDWCIDGPWDETRRSVYPPSTNQRVFLHGRRVNPEELPLYQHLRDIESRVGR